MKKMDTGIAKPVHEAAGSLHKYAGNAKPGTSMDKMKNSVGVCRD